MNYVNKNELLKYIAIAGYDVGFGAKKHFASFDIIEKGPGWLGLASLLGAIYSLFVPALRSEHVTALFVIFGVASLYLGWYGPVKQKYEDAGKALTGAFHDLHVLYRTVKSLPAEADLAPYLERTKRIRDSVLEHSISRQVFLADWYAHYKFFWQTQIDWIHEARPFSFFRDKVPLSAYLFVLFLAIVATLAVAIPSVSMEGSPSSTSVQEGEQE